MNEYPVHLSEYSEPRPDVCVLVGREEDCEQRHPTAAKIRLIFEVSDTSACRDTSKKALLFARAGIADYWVSLVQKRELVVFRRPSEEGYLETLRLTGADNVRPLLAPQVEFSVRDLLARPTAEEAPKEALYALGPRADAA